MKKTMATKIAFSGFMALFFACAQQKVELDQKARPFEGFDTTSVVSYATVPLKILAVADARDRGQAAGEARTGASYKKTPVFVSDSVETYVRNYLEAGLGKRDFLLVEKDQQAELQIRIKELWVEEVLEKYEPEKAKCRVSLEVVGRKADGQSENETYTGKFWSEVLSPGDLGDATEKLAPTLASCMNAIAEKMAADKKFVKFVKADPLF